MVVDGDFRARKLRSFTTGVTAFLGSFLLVACADESAPEDCPGTSSTSESDLELASVVLAAFDAKVERCWNESIRGEIDAYSPEWYLPRRHFLEDALLVPTQNGCGHLNAEGAASCADAIAAASCCEVESSDGAFEVCGSAPMRLALWNGTLAQALAVSTTQSARAATAAMATTSVRIRTRTVGANRRLVSRARPATSGLATKSCNAWKRTSIGARCARRSRRPVASAPQVRVKGAAGDASRPLLTATDGRRERAAGTFETCASGFRCAGEQCETAPAWVTRAPSPPDAASTTGARWHVRAATHRRRALQRGSFLSHR